MQGLHTFRNPLSQVPEGALEEALNIVIDRDGVATPRRGFFQYTLPFGAETKQLLNYKDRILTHYATTLAFENPALDGTFTSFSGSYLEAETGRRIRGIESNGNLYFTTSGGVKKISALTASDFTAASGYITQAGGVKALDLEAIADTATPGFLDPLSKVAYRMLWGITDANDNLILGAVSARTVVENKDPVNSAVVTLNFPIPDGITNELFFYQIYRTAVFTAPNLSALDSIDPGDEMNLVIEEFVTSAQITAGEITNLQDVTPEDFRNNGALLYTNPTSGQGILQNNEPPPFATDIEVYKGYTFYSNTSTRQQLTLSLLSVDDLVTGVSQINVESGVTTRTYTFRGTIETYTANFTGTTKANLDGNYFTLTSANNETLYKIWYDNTGSTPEPAGPAGSLAIKVDIQATPDTPTDLAQETLDAIDLASFDFNITALAGVLTIENANNGFVTSAPTETIGGAFTVSKDGLGTGEDAALGFVFLPRVPAINENGPSTSQQIDQAARSLIRVINFDASGIINAFYLSGFDDIPGAMLFEQKVVTGAAFNVFANSSLTASEFNPALGVTPATETLVSSSNEVRGNRMYFSKFQQPEAVPIVNYFDIGPRDKVIQRIIALNDSLFIFKQDGIYRLNGDVAPFSIAPFDFSLTLQAPDTAVVLNNQVHAFTTQGVVQVTDTGVNVISRQIEDKLLDIIKPSFNFNYRTASFGVSYETDRSYLLYTVTDSNDTTATQCFRFNTFTNTWVRWEMEKTCGIVNDRDNRLYLGAGDINIIEKERKELDRTDHADRQFNLTIIADGVNETQITLSNSSNVEVGDGLIQVQYLTISQFNRLLKRLDIDPGVSDTNYFSTLGANPGADLRSSLNNLALKLDADPGVNNTNFFSSMGGGSTFANIQSDFNIVIGLLNTDSGVLFQDYDQSTGTVAVEATVQALSETILNAVIISSAFPFLKGNITHYKAIQTRIRYVPQHAGDPSTFKQFSEGTFMFENNNFTLASVGYKSDLSPSVEEIAFTADGIGDWGQFAWSNLNWGGIASARPLRTLIPRQKQRCRFLQPQFEHLVAFEEWALLGMSLTVRPYSAKAYR
jgi:hypothetical protein